LIFAHTFGTGGPEIEMLLLAIALLALGIVFFVQKSTKPAVPVVLVLGALAAGAGAFALGANSNQNAPAGTVGAPSGISVSIASPRDGDTVAAGAVQLEVEVDGGSLTSETQSEDPTMGHLHIYVDNTLISMPSTETTDVELDSGEHTIAVEFTTADHRSFDPRITDEISVTAE
jgi:hypothetical protein